MRSGSSGGESGLARQGRFAEPSLSSFSRDPLVKKSESAVRQLCTQEDGATMIEYVLMIFLIAILCLAGVAAIGNIANLFYAAANTL